MNNISIHGRLVRNPEVKEYTTQKGESGKICTITVAVDRRVGEETDFFTCRAFGKRAEVIAQYFAKGKEIALTGSMECDPYEKDGTKHYPWSLKIDSFDFCGKKSDNESSPAASGPAAEMPDSMQALDEDVPF